MRPTLAALALALATAAPALGADATGLWRTEPDGQGRYLEVRIDPCRRAPALLCGRIVKARDRTGTRLDYPHEGRWMIRNMKPDGPDRWRDGRIWHPIHEAVFPAHMEISGRILQISGCALGGLICETQGWVRLE
ncbi:MAG: DUF2147 domain-containing protein [Alphaproteobacteria bacterium]|nr:MAG: DUF2147 domain-containing protein [Alphaproteobacteria bacterium]